MTWGQFKDTQSDVDIARGAAAEILQAYALGEYTNEQTVNTFHACMLLADTHEEAQAFRDGLAAMDTV